MTATLGPQPGSAEACAGLPAFSFEGHSMRRLIFSLMVAAGIAACLHATVATTSSVEWTQHGGNSLEQRYSTLNQVTADNVAKLGLAWYAEIPERGGYQSTPLMIDGVLYVTAPWSKLYAFDAKS